MQSRSIRRALVIAGPTLLAAVATLAACRDKTPELPTSPAEVSSSDHVSNIALRAERQRLAERNHLDWVGVAHNEALEGWRTELRRPGTMTRSMCRFVSEFFANQAFIPNGRTKGARAERLSTARAGAASTGRCNPKAKASARNVAQTADLSLAAYALIARAETAIDNAVDRYHLAGQLNTIMNDAYALGDAEREVILASLSVAQNSYEYWETELPVFAQELVREYSTCVTQYERTGYTSEDAWGTCVDAGVLPIIAPGVTGPSGHIRLAAFFSTPGCGLGSHYKALAKADLGGAIGGAVKGLFGGLAGVGAGALTGAAAGSAASFAFSTYELYKCALK